LRQEGEDRAGCDGGRGDRDGVDVPTALDDKRRVRGRPKAPPLPDRSFPAPWDPAAGHARARARTSERPEAVGCREIVALATKQAAGRRGYSAAKGRTSSPAQQQDASQSVVRSCGLAALNLRDLGAEAAAVVLSRDFCITVSYKPGRREGGGRRGYSAAKGRTSSPAQR
jgi:hypothetical protein